MTDTDLNAAPFNRLPWAVWLLILAVLGVEGVLSLADLGLIGGAQGIGWRISAIQDFAFSSAIQQSMIEGHHYVPRLMMRYVTFSFVAGNLMHALFGAVLIAALGKAVAEAFGNMRFLLVALVVPVAAAILFGLVTAQNQLGWLFGAMPMAFSLVGAFTWLKVHEAGDDRARRLRAFGLIAMLLLARLAFGLIAEGGPGWIAEFVAFVLAYGLSALILGPGSWQRTRARLRG
ncbi:MAG: rhomboid family intramembrane serine protease [Rhodobacter sp.]|nr:rhomboid family intramembrane serine protease [Paracoccaceae bacterium]MCB1408312.1 rhomboid family intramembrane serine protease [Paracoccaceae bacterium]MCC0079520.1 rhomboid family intramembrane serine protease [Rhodobacter sp.]